MTTLTPLHFFFYFFSAVAVCSALAVITARNPVRSVLSLVITFFAMAAVWMMLRAEFLALILILVYVGAVMTLFLFVVMMINIDRASQKGGFVRYLMFAVLLAALVTGLTIVAFGVPVASELQMPMPAAEAVDFSDIQYLGRLLFTDYVYPFEIAGALLLAAMIAAISLAHRGPVKRKVQHPSAQINVRPEDRLRIIKMPSEPRPSMNEGEA